MLIFRPSSFDHALTQLQMEQVLADKWGGTKWFRIHDDDDGNSQDMAVGFDAEGGGPFEIGISYIGDDEVVFHGNYANAFWQQMYNED